MTLLIAFLTSIAFVIFLLAVLSYQKIQIYFAFDAFPHLRYYTKMLGTKPKSISGGNRPQIIYAAKNNRLIVFYCVVRTGHDFKVREFRINLQSTKNDDYDLIFDSYGALPKRAQKHISSLVEKIFDKRDSIEKDGANQKLMAMNEAIKNGDNYNAAVAKQGPDVQDTKLWWAK